MAGLEREKQKMGTIERLKAKKSVIRAAIYARFSSENQRDESIDAQLRAIKDYAKRNNLVVVKIFNDRAKSATTDKRPGFLEMIEESKKKNFDVVLVHKLDRFARNRHDSIGYRMELKRNGVSLISVLENLDDESPESLILESVLEAMAEYYSKNLARETQKGLMENAMKCMHTGGKPPLGYEVDPETKHLIINVKEAAAVQYIFKLYIEGYGYKKIVIALKEKGFRTKKGSVIGKSSLYSILRNEKYKGLYIFNKSKAKDIDGKRNGHAYKSDDEIIRIDEGVPSIIKSEDFDLVQQKLKTNVKTKAKYKAKEVYLLSGKISCGECGSSFAGNRRESGHTAKSYFISYRCNKRDRTAECINKEIKRDHIEAYVLEKLAEYVFDDSLIPIMKDEYSSYQTSKKSDVILIYKNLKKRLNAVDYEISNLVNLLAKTGSEALLVKLSKLENEKAELQDNLNGTDLDDFNEKVSVEQIIQSFKKARDMFREGKLINTRKLVELFTDRVIVFEDHIDIYYNFRPNFQMPQVDVNFQKSAAYQKPFLSDEKRKIGCAHKTPTDSSCSTTYRGYNGGEGGIRTRVWFPTN